MPAARHRVMPMAGDPGHHLEEGCAAGVGLLAGPTGQLALPLEMAAPGALTPAVRNRRITAFSKMAIVIPGGLPGI
jgi:hypothetical protein